MSAKFRQSDVGRPTHQLGLFQTATYYRETIPLSKQLSVNVGASNNMIVFHI